MILVPLLNPKFAIELAASACELRVGALAAGILPLSTALGESFRNPKNGAARANYSAQLAAIRLLVRAARVAALPAGVWSARSCLNHRARKSISRRTFWGTCGDRA
jgi:hypothetical protein